MSKETMPIACDPEAIPREQRASHTVLARRLFGEQRGATVHHGAEVEGYEFEFEDALFDDLARWVANERRCCPFLRFTLDLHPAGGPIGLTMSGPEGTRAFIEAEMLGSDLMLFRDGN